MQQPENVETVLIRPPTALSTTGTTTGSGSVRIAGMPAEIARHAAERLHWLALLCPIGVISVLGIQALLQPEIRAVGWDPLELITAASVILLSLGLFAAYRFFRVAPATMVNLGSFYQVACALAIGIFENILPRQPDAPVLGTSRIAAWIILASLIMTNVPWKSLMAGLACTAMVPIAHWICAWHFGYPVLPWNKLFSISFFSLLMAVISYLLIRRTYRIERELCKAKELGSYRLESLIGKGGMGEVWRARHHFLAREAAVKLISAEHLATQGASAKDSVQRRFEKEAQATATLRSPHTVVLFDYGVTREGSFYYVMELLDGIDLDTLVRRHGPLPPGRAVYLLLQACESLAEAHALGMIHRDIKPSNLFVCRMGLRCDHLKVLDFGLVGAVNRADAPRLTMVGTTTGTPLFMSPEQAMGLDDLDARSDVYSLGCVAYFLLTGETVFNEPTSVGVVIAQIQKTPQPLSMRSKAPIPQELEQVVMSCLAKDRDARPSDARELGRRLRRCAGISPWTDDDAEQWWRLNQPSPRTAEPDADTPTVEIRV